MLFNCVAVMKNVVRFSAVGPVPASRGAHSATVERETRPLGTGWRAVGPLQSEDLMTAHFNLGPDPTRGSQPASPPSALDPTEPNEPLFAAPTNNGPHPATRALGPALAHVLDSLDWTMRTFQRMPQASGRFALHYEVPLGSRFAGSNSVLCVY